MLRFDVRGVGVAGCTCILFACCTGLLVADGDTAASADASKAPAVVHLDDLVRIADAGGGKLTEELRDAYLLYTERLVLADLKKANREIPANVLEWVRNDPELRDAAFGAIYPRDPRVLRNLYLLHRDLGEDFCIKYKQLVIAQAVGRRMVGVGRRATAGKFKKYIEPVLKRETRVRREGRIFWPKEPVAGAIKPGSVKLSAYEEPTLPTPKPTPEGQKPKTIYDAMFDFMCEKNVTAQQIYMQKPKLPIELWAYTKSKGFPFYGGKKKLHKQLMLMLRHKGLRDGGRDPYPSSAEYCLWLAHLHEDKPHKPDREVKGIWPLFPIQRTPWPGLLPLSKGQPIREAAHIIRRYSGEIPMERRKERFQSYGKYRGTDKVELAMLDPLPWAVTSWPGIVHQGGACGTMSSIGVGTHSAFGIPNMKGGQTKHSCFIVYKRIWSGDRRQEEG